MSVRRILAALFIIGGAATVALVALRHAIGRLAATIDGWHDVDWPDDPPQFFQSATNDRRHP